MLTYTRKVKTINLNKNTFIKIEKNDSNYNKFNDIIDISLDPDKIVG